MGGGINRQAGMRTRIGYSVSILFCLLLGSCALDEALPVRWNFSFDCKQDASRTQLVELTVAKGGCPITGLVVFETSTSMWSAPGSRPQGLPAGLYAFQGTARDANRQPIASHCTSVQLPVEEAIAISLRGVSACGSNNTGLDAGPEDSGTADTGTADTGIADTGTADTGTEGGPPDDGSVADASIDNCPTDPDRTEPGKCGCNAETTMSNATLLVGESLCAPRDDDVRLTMEVDGSLHLYVDGVQVWVSINKLPDDGSMEKGSKAVMQGSDGNLVIRTPTNSRSVWSSATSVPFASKVLTVNANGTATISDATKVYWTVP